MKQVTIMKAKLEIMEQIDAQREWNEDAIKRATECPDDYDREYIDLITAKREMYEAILNSIYKTEKWGI